MLTSAIHSCSSTGPSTLAVNLTSISPAAVLTRFGIREASSISRSTASFAWPCVSPPHCNQLADPVHSNAHESLLSTNLHQRSNFLQILGGELSRSGLFKKLCGNTNLSGLGVHIGCSLDTTLSIRPNKSPIKFRRPHCNVPLHLGIPGQIFSIIRKRPDADLRSCSICGSRFIDDNRVHQRKFRAIYGLSPTNTTGQLKRNDEQTRSLHHSFDTNILINQTPNKPSP